MNRALALDNSAPLTVLAEAAALSAEDEHTESRYAMNVVELLEAVEKAPSDWLVQGLWPEGSYGVLGAEDKAGKTFAAADMVVSVATGTPWFSCFPTKQGNVLALFGEGGERAFHRRLEGICESKALKILDLEGHLRTKFTPVDITSSRELNSLGLEMSAHPPALVVLDPLYLSVGDSKGNDLYGMGKALGGLQTICQRIGSALLVTTHWNRTGTGTGASRFTGVGPGAWGRVLMSASVARSITLNDGTSDVTLRFTVTGSETPETGFLVRRQVHAESDDLGSALAYSVEVTQALTGPLPEQGERLSPAAANVLKVLKDAPHALSRQDIGDAIVKTGLWPEGYRVETISRKLAELRAAGLVEPRMGGMWTAIGDDDQGVTE